MGGREHGQLVHLGEHLAGQGIDAADALDLVTEQLDAHGHVLVGRMDLDRVTPDAELPPDEVRVVAVVLHVDQAAQDRPLVVDLARAEQEDLLGVLLR